MSNITDVKSVLTQKGLDIFCHKFSIPKDVHPQLPSPNQTIHEMPTGKIGVYTRFFEYANFRLPLSTFLVNVLRHYRINLSQLLVIAAAKVSHLEILCHVHSIEPTVGLFHMDLFAFIQVVDPTKVKVVERERAEGEAKLVNSTVGHVGDSAADGGHDGACLRILDTDFEDTVAGNVTAERPRRQRKKKRELLTDASGFFPIIQEIKGRHSGTFMGKWDGPYVMLLAHLRHPSVLSEGLVISSDSSHLSSTNAAEAGIDSFVKSVAPPPVMTEAVITTNVAIIPFVLTPETDTKVISPFHASMFHDSDSTGIVRSDAAGSSHIPGNKLSIRSRDINFETLREVFVSQWNISNNTLLDDHDGSRKFIDNLAPPVLFSQIREMDYHYLFTKFNVGTARQACLNAEVRMRTEYYMSERKRLESKCESQADLLKAKDTEIENLKAQLLLKEVEVAEAARLRIQVSAAEATEKMHADEIDVLKQRNMALENEKDSLDGKIVELQSSVSTKDLELKDLNVAVSSLRSQKDGLVDQVAKLDVDLLEMALHLEEKFYPHLLTTMYGRRWLLTHGLKLAIVKCLNSQEYLLALGAAIIVLLRRGCKMGCQSALFMERKVGVWRMLLLNVAAEADYNSALQRLRGVDFPLLSELSSHKNASVEDIMNLLRLEGPLADAPEMSDLQLNIDHLMLLVH
ncbi:hypothetical protein Tco_0888863 [Tanacetum coccineum]